MQRLRAWFHNHTRKGGSGSQPRGVLKIKGKYKGPQEWQVYEQMPYGSKWKPDINKEWAALDAEWASQNPNIKNPKSLFVFRNEFLKAKYAEEPEDVKKLVQERREQLKIEATKKVEPQNQNGEYQK
jgi:hypothetical protein